MKNERHRYEFKGDFRHGRIKNVRFHVEDVA